MTSFPINHFQGKRIFVTGHTGFKGSWLIRMLHLLGAQVRGFALNPVEERSLYHSIAGDSICESIICDIRDVSRLTKEMIAFKPDYLFHLAAQPLVLTSYEQPVYTYEVNVMGTVHVLEGLRQLSNACTAVLITTDKVYENLESGQYYKEGDRLGGYDPYSSSKACTELAIASYRSSFFEDVTIKSGKSVSVARAGNVIGGGDWAPNRIIPDIVRSLSEGEPIQIRNPDSVRPWQHVLEPLEGYLTLAYKQSVDPKTFSSPFNFGPFPENTHPVKELVQKVIDCWGAGEWYSEPMKNPTHHEAGLLHLDLNKAVSELSWRPTWSFEETIKITIDWYKNFMSDPAGATVLMDSNIKMKLKYD